MVLRVLLQRVWATQRREARRLGVPGRLHAGAVSADPAELVITAGDAELRLDDVLVGDVWLCAGQSNMAWPLGKAATAEAALQRADRRDIRLLHLRERAGGNAVRYSAELLRDLEASNLFENDGWRHSSAESAADFSAVAWFFEKSQNSPAASRLRTSARSGASAKRSRRWTPASSSR